MVVKRGVNEDSIVPMARHFRGSGHILRFIEYMDVGHSNGWRMDDVVPAAEIVATMDGDLPLEPVGPNYFGEVAERWRYSDGGGEIGVIASVTQPFCGGCTGPRLSAEGKLYTCLFSGTGTRPAAPPCGRARRTRRSRPWLRGCALGAAGGSLLGDPHRGERGVSPAAGWRCPTSADSIRPGPGGAPRWRHPGNGHGTGEGGREGWRSRGASACAGSTTRATPCAWG